MKPTFDSKFARELWYFRKLASQPGYHPKWFDDMEEISRLAGGVSPAPGALAAKYLDYVHRVNQLAQEEARRSSSGEGAKADESPAILDRAAKMGRLCSLAIRAMGSTAHGALLSMYRATPKGHPDRWPLLCLLADTGHPKIGELLREKGRTELFEAARASFDLDLYIETGERDADVAKAVEALGSKFERASTCSREATLSWSERNWMEIAAGTRADDYSTRWRAAEALGEINDSRGAELLARLADDDNPYVRKAARDALGGRRSSGETR